MSHQLAEQLESEYKKLVFDPYTHMVYRPWYPWKHAHNSKPCIVVTFSQYEPGESEYRKVLPQIQGIVEANGELSYNGLPIHFNEIEAHIGGY